MPRGKAHKTWALIDAAMEILAEIEPATVRAVCYKLFTQGLLTSMTKSETNKVSAHLTWAREHGQIPWEWIVEETREAETRATWADPAAFVDALQDAYRRDYWRLQPSRVEVWSEKGTVRGTLAPILDAYGMTFRVMHGYASATAVHQLVEDQAAERRPLRALYVGDWDPSGLHMSEVDPPRRLAAYQAHDGVETPPAVSLIRIALTRINIADSALESFPADSKQADSRWPWYRRQYGPRCWELDALDPRVLRDRVQAAIVAQIEPAAWARCVRAEAAERESIHEVLTAWRTRISGQAQE
jgi:hypothetical protein